MPVRCLLVALILLVSSPSVLAQTVGFINPGRSDEPFWVGVSDSMKAAARSLDMKLEVLYAERDPARALQLGREIAARAQRPDYVILVNEKGTLVENARVLGAAGVKTFAAFSGLLPQEHERWAPRKGLPLLLGSLEPRAQDAGYLTAKALIRQALAGKPAGARLQMLAISGDRSTPVSIQRNDGLRQALSEHPQVELVQQAFADWRRDLAAETMAGLLSRHPQARLLWTGSDLMAFGAMEAIENAGQSVARDWRISSINTSKAAMQAVVDGRLKALAGGHFMAGAWALVMLYDHHHGRDFADEGLELEKPMFMLFSRAQAQRVLAHFGDETSEMNFRPYSKHLNPGIKRYRFDIAELLK